MRPEERGCRLTTRVAATLCARLATRQSRSHRPRHSRLVRLRPSCTLLRGWRAARAATRLAARVLGLQVAWACRQATRAGRIRCANSVTHRCRFRSYRLPRASREPRPSCIPPREWKAALAATRREALASALWEERDCRRTTRVVVIPSASLATPGFSSRQRQLRLLASRHRRYSMPPTAGRHVQAAIRWADQGSVRLEALGYRRTTRDGQMPCARAATPGFRSLPPPLPARA